MMSFRRYFLVGNKSIPRRVGPTEHWKLREFCWRFPIQEHDSAERKQGGEFSARWVNYFGTYLGVTMLASSLTTLTNTPSLRKMEKSLGDTARGSSIGRESTKFGTLLGY